MDDKISRVLFLTDRVLVHLAHQIPPETEVTAELRTLLDELQREREKCGPVDLGLESPNTSAVRD
jgi:hypothetical protein